MITNLLHFFQSINRDSFSPYFPPIFMNLKLPLFHTVCDRRPPTEQQCLVKRFEIETASLKCIYEVINHLLSLWKKFLPILEWVIRNPFMRHNCFMSCCIVVLQLFYLDETYCCYRVCFFQTDP